MKTIEQIATKKAYNMFFSTSNILLTDSQRIYRNFDFRTNIDKKAFGIFKQLEQTVDKSKIKQIKKERIKRKSFEQNNILDNKLLLDFKRNRCYIYNNHLSDGYRNHWAKNNQDLKVLSVLRKHYPNLSK